MSRRAASLLLCLGLFGATVFLGFAVVEEARPLWRAQAFEGGGGPAAGALGSAEPEEVAAPPGFVARGSQTYREALDRPIFSPARRPPELAAATPVQAATAPQPSLDLQLHGIVLGGDASVALLAVGGQEPLQRLSIGAEIGGWRVDAIDAEGVLLRQGGQTNRLRLDFGESAQ